MHFGSGFGRRAGKWGAVGRPPCFEHRDTVADTFKHQIVISRGRSSVGSWRSVLLRRRLALQEIKSHLGRNHVRAPVSIGAKQAEDRAITAVRATTRLVTDKHDLVGSKALTLESEPVSLSVMAPCDARYMGVRQLSRPRGDYEAVHDTGHYSEYILTCTE